MQEAPTFHRPLLLSIGQTLHAIFNNRQFADKSIEKLFKSKPKWGSRDRKFVAESIYEVVRFYRRYAFLQNLKEAYTEFDFLTLWGVYAYEKWGVDSVLGVDFSLVTYQAQLAKLSNQSLAIQHSWPDHLADYFAQQLGARWPLISKNLNQLAPVDVRVNTLKITRSSLQQLLQDETILSSEVGEVGLTLQERKNVFATNSFKQGFFEVQDRASQQIALLMDPAPGEQVCDACAGAGGKSLHLATLMQNKGRIVSMDIHQWKLDELKKRSKRNGISIIDTRVIDTTKVVKRQAERFDKVLLDVPCTGSGVIRRNPDTKYKLSIERIQELLKIQQDILRVYANMVKPGGYLVYATCSVLPVENEQQVKIFLDSHLDSWKLVKEWNNDPSDKNGDGFFAAKLQRLKK